MTNPTEQEIDAAIDRINELGETAALFEIAATPLILTALKALKGREVDVDK